MTEYIKKEDAIEALMPYFMLPIHTKEQFEQAKRIAEGIINTIPLEKRLRWIPLKERLTKYDEDVLVTTKYEDVRIMYRTDDNIFGNIDYWSDGDSIFNNDEILAWMPLLEPYRESDEE